MQLSIITICYNIAGDIERTCESIVDQTWQDFEWIVIDGGSTDGTLDILNKYRDRINILISERDTGIYNAMNKGIQKAQGEYINFMNGGDLFHDKTVLEHVATQFADNADVLYGDAKFTASKTELFMKMPPRFLTTDYFKDDCICHQASFIKRILFKKYGLYNEQYKVVSDWERWIIFSLGGCTFAHLNMNIAIHFYDGISSTGSKLHIKEKEDVIHKYFILPKENEIEKNLFYYILRFKKTSSYTYLILFGFIPLLKIGVQER